MTTSVGEKADHILTKGETLTDSLSVKTERTADVVQKSVTGPLISISSLITGISKGFAVYTHSSKARAKVQADITHNARRYEDI